MSLYPSLEDMKVDQIIQNQQHFQNFNNGQSASAIMPQGLPSPSDNQAVLYPNIMEYMGLSLTPELLKYNQVALPTPSQVAIRTTQSNQMQVAPVTGNDPGLMRAEVKQGIRQVVLCKDQNGKIGLKLQSVNKGVFVSFVESNSAASLAGLRFGDQILQINEQTVAGWDNDKVSKFIKKADPGRITMAVRDRPFERTVTLQKDSLGTLGFMFKDNKITSIVKDSSAARNGILINHHMVEIDGRNVVGLKEKEVKEIVDSTGRTVTVTIIPTFIFEHIMKSIGWGLVKKKMDHSVPEL